MREGIVNSAPGELPGYDTPNVKANKITFSTGGIGEDSAPVTISREDFKKEDNLKLLASAQAGELTWNYENGNLVSVTVQKERPVVVSTPDAGGVIVNSTGKPVYLAATSPVKDADGNVKEGSALHILSDINAGNNNVKLQAGNGITVAKDNGGAGTITAKNLILHGGLGDVGTSAKPVQTDISGTLDANSAKSIAVHQVSTEHDLTLKSVIAGDAIELTADKAIEMMPTRSEEASGHLSAKSHIDLTALGGGVGQTEAIRILAGDAEVNIKAKNNTQVVGKPNVDNSLVLGTVTVSDGSFTAKAKNDIKTGAVQAKNDVSLLSTEGAVTNNKTVTSSAGNISINAQKDITNNGVIKADKEIRLTAAEGNINSASATGVYLDAGASLTLQAERGDVGSADSALRIRNNKNVPINVTARNAWLQGVANTSGTDTNNMTLGAVRVANGFTAESEGNIVSGTGSDAYLDAGTQITLQAEKGNVGSADQALRVLNKNNVPIDVTAQNAWLKGVANTSGADTNTMSLRNVRVNNLLHAESEGTLKTNAVSAGKAELAAADDVEIGGLLAVDTEFTAKAKGRIYETESGVVRTQSGTDKVELEAGRGIALDNRDNSFVRLVVHGTENANASGGYNAIDGNVSITVNGDRDWSLMAPEIMDEAIPVKGILATIGSPVNGNVSLVNVAKDATVVLYKNGIVTNKGEAGEGDVSIAADKTIVVTQEISAAHDVSVKSNAGHIYVKHAIEAKEGSIRVTTGEGNIHVGDSGPNRKTITAKKDITLATDLGKIDIHGKTESLEGDITLSAKSKEYNPGADGMNILLSDQGVVKAAGYVNLKTENGDIHITDRIISGEGLTAEITKQGSVYFDRSVLVNKDVLISADQGSIHVGNSVASRNGNISMQTVNGHVNVDNNVTALNGDISLKTVCQQQSSRQ